MSRHTTYFELLEALDQPGCSLCRLTRRSVREYFAALGYEQVNDVELREALRSSGGFCPRHAWLFLEESGNRLGVAIIYRDLLQTRLERLASGPGRAAAGLGRRLGRLLGGPPSRGAEREAGCRACLVEVEAERRYRGTLLEQLGETGLRERFAASVGLCLPHFERAIDASQDGEQTRWLQADATRRLGGLVADLDEYIRKHDYRFRQEGFGGEEDSPTRAVERSVGSRVREAAGEQPRGRMSGPTFASRSWGERKHGVGESTPPTPDET